MIHGADIGRVVVPRAHEEHVPDGPVRLGVWLTNTRTRRTALSEEQRAALAALGLEWA
ncbi:helicase associated domain-containing protein [Streptomyces sp. NPDC059881]|uniref:helicase associated domain-containing protein n=1 Tax=Streptomyces sp. NPDC059881 TaxID=3346986 RepID=UPI00366202ED